MSRPSLGLIGLILAAAAATGRAQDRPAPEVFSFKTNVELINVTATVVDERGRFVPGLRAQDFVVLEDGRPQAVQQFEAERVPVSLGIALDSSGSMLGEKMSAALGALNRFLFDLLGDRDEVFLYRFDGRPNLIAGWTSDRRRLVDALGAVKPSGGTALFDTVAEAVPLAQSGTREKKALVIISDGNDTSSHTRLAAVTQQIRQTEVLVYAIGIDASDGVGYSAGSAGQSRPTPVPAPFPGKRPAVSGSSPSHSPAGASTDRINPDVLRALTDDSGGRTEVITSPRDLAPATAGIADELSRQYFLGYSSSLPKDGRWHTIDVRLVRPGSFTVRARKGFIAN